MFFVYSFDSIVKVWFVLIVLSLEVNDMFWWFSWTILVVPFCGSFQMSSRWWSSSVPHTPTPHLDWIRLVRRTLTGTPDLISQSLNNVLQTNLIQSRYYDHNSYSFPSLISSKLCLSSTWCGLFVSFTGFNVYHQWYGRNVKLI